MELSKHWYWQEVKTASDPPPDNISVLVWPGYHSNKGWQIGAWWDDDGVWRDLDGDSIDVTHYIHLPPPLEGPEEKETRPLPLWRNYNG